MAYELTVVFLEKELQSVWTRPSFHNLNHVSMPSLEERMRKKIESLVRRLRYIGRNIIYI